MRFEKIKKIGVYVLAGLGGLVIVYGVVVGPMVFLRKGGVGVSGGTYALPEKRAGVRFGKPLGLGGGRGGGGERAERREEGGKSGAGQSELTERKVVKNGSLSLLVEKAEETAAEIKEKAKEAGGYVQHSDIYEVEKGVKKGRLVIRVPAKKFGRVMEEIKGMAVKVEKESQDTRDVTEKYLDLEARLKNRRAEEEQYLEIMNKAEEIEDILKVSNRLSRVRGKIERLEARMDYLSKQVDMSTITVRLTSEAEVEVLGVRWRPLYNVKKSVKSLIKGLTNYVDTLIRFVFALPVILAWTVSGGVLLVVGLRVLRWVWTGLVRREKRSH